MGIAATIVGVEDSQRRACLMYSNLNASEFGQQQTAACFQS